MAESFEFSMHNLRKKSESVLRKEYSRVRKNYRRRMERFGKNPVLSQSHIYKEWKNQAFPTLKEIDAQGLDIASELNQLGRRYNQKNTYASTAMKQVEEAVNILRKDYGYTFINKNNYYSYMDFLKNLKYLYGSNFVDSDEAAQLFEQGEKHKLSNDDMLKHYDEYINNLSLLRKTEYDPRKKSSIRSFRQRKYLNEEGKPYEWERDKS